MTRAPRSERRLWSLRNLATTASVAVFLTLVGSGASYAYWTATANVTATVVTGQVTVDLTTKDLDAVAFGNELTQQTGSFTVKNTSTADGNVTISLRSTDTDASKFGVSIWPRPTAADCASAVPPTTGIVAGTWAQADLTVPLAADASATYCVLTAVSDRSAVASATGILSLTPSIAATLNVHGWQGTVSTTAHITTNQIFPTVAPAVGDVYILGAQCVVVTDGIAPTPATPAACARVEAMSQSWQAQVRSGGNYQFIDADSGLCEQANQAEDGFTPALCDGTAAQQFTLVHEQVTPGP